MGGNIPPSRFEGTVLKIQIMKLRTNEVLKKFWREVIYCPLKHQQVPGRKPQRPMEIDPRPDVRDDGAAEFEDPLITPYPAQHDLIPLLSQGDVAQDPQAPSVPSTPYPGNPTTPKKHLHTSTWPVDIIPKTSRQSLNRQDPDSLVDPDRKAIHLPTSIATSGPVATPTDEGKERTNYLEMKVETALGFPSQAGGYVPSNATQNDHYRPAQHSSPSLPVSTLGPPGYLESSADDTNHQLPPGGTFHGSYMPPHSIPPSIPSESTIPRTEAQLRKILSILQSLPALEPKDRRDEVLQSFDLLQFSLGEAGILRLFASEDEYEQLGGVLEISTRDHERVIQAFEEGRRYLIDLLKRREGTMDRKGEPHEVFAIKQFKRCFRILGLHIWRVRPMLSEGSLAI